MGLWHRALYLSSLVEEQKKANRLLLSEKISIAQQWNYVLVDFCHRQEHFNSKDSKSPVAWRRICYIVDNRDVTTSLHIGCLFIVILANTTWKVLLPWWIHHWWSCLLFASLNLLIEREKKLWSTVHYSKFKFWSASYWSKVRPCLTVPERNLLSVGDER